MLGNMGWLQILLILLIILLIFGAARLPALAKSLGQSARAFKGEMKQMKDEDTNASSDAPTSNPPATGETSAPSPRNTPPAEPTS